MQNLKILLNLLSFYGLFFNQGCIVNICESASNQRSFLLLK